MLKKYLPYFLLTIIVLTFSLTLLLNLQYPREICNDEFYYAPAGQTIWQTPNEPNLEHHPPLAKYLIGFGIMTVGNYSIGWRLIPALFGIIGLILVFFLTKEVLSLSANGDRKVTIFFSLFAPFLLAFDFLYFTMSRQAMLDIFVTTFLIATSLFIWKYIQTQRKIFIILLAIFFYVTLASKWTTILFAPLFLFLTLKYTKTRKIQKKSFKIVMFEYLLIGLIGATVYLCTYIPYLLKNNAGEFMILQKDILVRMLYTKETNGGGTSPFNTIFWPFFPSNTLSCYFDYEDNVNPHSLSIISNPLIIWFFWPVLIYSFYQAFKKKEIKRFFIPIIIICLYLPWLAVEREKYFYYMTPVIPFLCILIAQMVFDFITTKGKGGLNNIKPQNPIFLPNKDLLDKIIIFLYKLQEKTHKGKLFQKLSKKADTLIANKLLIYILVICYLLLVILLFILYYPLLNGLPVSESYRNTVTFFWPF